MERDKYATDYVDKVREKPSASPKWHMVEGLCSLCRINYATSMHHLIPRAFSRDRGATGRLIPTCRPCHIFIHKAFSHRELATKYDTAQKLRSNKLVNQFVTFVGKRAVGKRIKGRRILIQDGLVFLQTGKQFQTAYG